MKNLFLLLIIVLGFLAGSCGSDKKDNPSPSFKGCRLLERKFTLGNGTDTAYFVYEYNSDNTMKSVKEKLINSPTFHLWLLEYNNLKQLVKESYQDEFGNVGVYYTYDYDANGKLLKKTHFHKNGNSYIAHDVWLYNYDSNGDLVRQDRSDSSYITYTYSNLKQVANGYYASGAFEGSNVTEFENRQLPLISGENLSIFHRYSRNPPIKQSFFTPSGGNTREKNWSYQYNAEGYIKMAIESSPGATTSGIWTFTYECR